MNVPLIIMSLFEVSSLTAKIQANFCFFQLREIVRRRWCGQGSRGKMWVEWWWWRGERGGRVTGPKEDGEGAAKVGTLYVLSRPNIHWFVTLLVGFRCSLRVDHPHPAPPLLSPRPLRLEGSEFHVIKCLYFAGPKSHPYPLPTLTPQTTDVKEK